MGQKFRTLTCWASVSAVLVLSSLCAGVGAHTNQQAYGANPQQHNHGHQQPPQQNPQHQNVHQQGSGSHGHGHTHGGQQQGVFDRSQVQDREHIKEHLDGVAQADTSKMSEQELQFHYFKMHDSDNNNKLDGCELIKSLIHWHEEDRPVVSGDGDNQTEPLRIFQDEELTSMVDSILVQDDRNVDGFIDYLEYMEMLKTPGH